MDKNKLILPITILLAAIIIGGFVYASQIIKQQSIEKQQQIKIEEDKKIREEEASENLKNKNRLQECLNSIDKGLNDYREIEEEYCLKQYPIK